MPDDFARRMWESTAQRHHNQATQHLEGAYKRIGYMLRELGQVDPTNLTATRLMPGETHNVIADLVEVAKRLAILDELRDFEPVFKPAGVTVDDQ